MTPDNLPEKLHAHGRRTSSRDAGCPSEMDIAAYVEGNLVGIAHHQLQVHLADCNACLGLVGLLSRERHAAIDEAVPADTVAQVADIKVVRGPKGTWARVQPYAVAATLVLLVPLLVFMRPGSEMPTADPAPEITRALRAVDAQQQMLHVISPAPEASVRRGDLDLRWSEVPGTPHYDVRIVSEDGELIATKRVKGTEWRPPADVALRPGGSYYLKVDAYPVGDKALSSEHSAFRIRD